MQLKTYAKKNQIPATEIIESLTSQFAGTWMLSSELNHKIIEFLDTTFGNTQTSLPPAKETLQLPQATPESTQIAPTQPQELTTNQTSTTNTQLTCSPLEALLDADAVATQMIIQQRIEANNIKLAEMVNNRYVGFESQLIDSLQSKYAQIASYKAPTYTNQSEVNRQVFDELKAKLEAYKEQSKSR
jgi:hypothetical protein